jgi:hypothetical protein
MNIDLHSGYTKHFISAGIIVGMRNCMSREHFSCQISGFNREVPENFVFCAITQRVVVRHSHFSCYFAFSSEIKYYDDVVLGCGAASLDA